MAESFADRVLILAPVGRDGPASAELLTKAGLRPLVCAAFEAMIEALHRGAAALFVAEEALFGRDLTALQAWVAAQPPWSDLPIIILTSHRQDPRVAAWRQKLVAQLGNVAMLERPVHPITLSSTLQAAVRARHRQYEVRSLIEARERAAAQLQRRVDEATAELRQQMDERSRIQDALRQAQKMEAIGQLTGGVAHDFNNLLMVIIAGLEMIERHRNSERFASFVESMRSAAQRGASLTRQLLAFSRRQPLKTEAVDLARHFDGMRELLDRSVGSNIRLLTNFAADLWPVEVDPNELELVILNLAFNARDAMPDGGTITVQGENVAEGFVRLTVADTGSGMPADVAARAFEPFFTTKEIGKGSGLGLAQAYGFAHESGGSVEIQTEPGYGTRIVLTLPRSRSSVPERSPQTRTSAPERPDDHRAGEILLVEDDDEVALLVSEMLDQLGYHVLRTATASAALGALANGRQIDLVFSDIMMPGGMDGVGLARELHHRRPHLPVLLTTGHPGAARLDIEGKGLHVLAKPYQLDDLRVALAEAFRSAAS
jgi:signal transduction histidine kinase/ActR/RegA family two-component response regulator